MIRLPVNPPSGPVRVAPTPRFAPHPLTYAAPIDGVAIYARWGCWLLPWLLALVSVVGLAPMSVSAAEPAFTVGRNFGTGARSLAVGDVNGDGYLDLVTGNSGWSGEREAIYLNDGAGNFPVAMARRYTTGREQTNSVALGDVNGDGYLDIIAGAAPQRDETPATSIARQNMVYLNDGAGNFPAALARPFGTGHDSTVSIAVGDLNRDGYLDIVTGNQGQPSVVYRNDGAGNFPAALAHAFSTGRQSTTSVAVGDLNGDGYLDIVTGKSDAPNLVYRNDGAGNFPTALARSFGTGAEWTKSVTVGDLNGDGHLDLITGNELHQNVVYLNDGADNFPTATLPSYSFGTGRDRTSSVVVGDVNGDGHLDLITGNELHQNVVYLNDGAGNIGAKLNFGTGSDYTNCVAVADVNGDNHLDLITGNYIQPNMVYLNDGAGNFAAHESDSLPFGTAQQAPSSVVVADLNSDGALDIVMGNPTHWDPISRTNISGQNMVYLNNGDGHFPHTAVYTRAFGTGNSTTTSVAVGDLNNDGYPDIVTGNESQWDESRQYVGGQNFVYLNDGASDFPVAQARPFGTGRDNTKSVVVGDLNGDGYLDIVVGNGPPTGDVPGQAYVGEQAMIYLNDGAGNFPSARARPFGAAHNNIGSVVVVDMNGDSHLDLVTGGAGQNMVYLNDGVGNLSTTQARPFGTGHDSTTSVAVGDLNGDGYLDIITGNEGEPNVVYLNDGSANFPTEKARSFGTGGDDTTSIAVGDLNGDGHLDIVTGNINRQQNVLYLNDGAGNFPTGRFFGTGADDTLSVAVADVDSDGNLDIITGNYDQQNMVYLNKRRRRVGLVNQSPRLTITPSGLTTRPILSSPTISITYTLFDPEGEPMGQVAAFYSADGGGKWLPAVAASGTVTQHLATAPNGVTHTFLWNTFASGLFGQSDNVVVRLLAYPQPPATTTPITATYLYTNSVAGFTQWAYAGATTLPFRVRGTQVRVVDEENAPLPGALVYWLPAGQFFGATPLADLAGQPFRTNGQGYLSGRGALQQGDGLVALLPVTPTQPITFTKQYSYFLTSAAPTVGGLALTKVRDPGVITLTIPISEPARHPLLLFHLLVSLEWDASDDELFRLGLEEGFKRAAELLFDVTDGQVAIGRVDVLPAKSDWNRADLILYASNSLRPSAAIGGVVNQPVSEFVRPAFDQPATKPITNAYLPGQIRMGVSWDPFGEEAGDLSEQWWRALAHELAHHLLFLPDNYLGFKADDPEQPDRRRFLGRVDCQGSFMTTTFDPSYTEFLQRGKAWADSCLETLAEQTTARPDWATITHFYPMLKAPATPQEGPNLLPLAVTRTIFWTLPNARPTLPARYFQIRDSRTGEVIRLPTARVYLFQTQDTADPTDDLLLALGSPTGGGDRIKVRGGQPKDRLCLFDFGASDGKTYTGCIPSLSAANVAISVNALDPAQTGARWAPTIDVQAITTRTFAITVTQILSPSAPLKVQLFPAHYPSAPALAPVAALTLTNGVYVGQVQLPYPASDVAVRVWVEGRSNLEAISQFNLQLPWKPDDPVMAGPNTRPMGGPNTRPMGGPNTRPMGGTDYPIVGGTPHYPFAAPALSADAQVVIYNQTGIFEPNGIQSLQILPSSPEVRDESWLVLVGQAYFVQPAPMVDAKRAIAMTYLQRDVPEGYEHTLTLYFLPQGDTHWQRLPTQQFVENLLIADLQPSAGTYAIMSTIKLPEFHPGLNLFTYPLADTRPVTTALASLAGRYSELYEVKKDGILQFAPTHLVFGHTYLLRIQGSENEEAILYLAPPRRLPDGTLPGMQ